MQTKLNYFSFKMCRIQIRSPPIRILTPGISGLFMESKIDKYQGVLLQNMHVIKLFVGAEKCLIQGNC